MKITLKTTKPRNPFALPAAQRAAGAHRTGKQRQRLQRELRNELHPLQRSP
ncbi:MAG: hypothetical protein JNM33_09640 [Rubrivivax sp.]|nr:hypothetical protein [Rubrivivax sp.]